MELEKRDEKRLSVSDVGYRLGFTNLSHFTKVFENHIGMKPKQYSVKKYLANVTQPD
ncbi:AraC-like DNA-binding protein [Pedobacter sp. UYP24]